MTEQTPKADLDESLEKALETNEEGTVQPAGAEAEESTEIVDVPKIPEDIEKIAANWKEDPRTKWMSLAGNEENHETLRAISEQLSADYGYRTQLEQQRAELEQRAQYADRWGQLAQQYGDVMRGRNPLDVVGEYLYYGQQLAQNPQATILALAQQYGVDLNAAVQDQPYVDDATRALYQQNQQLMQRMHTFEDQQAQAHSQQLWNMGNEFANAKDAEGNLLHPHLSKVQNQVAQMFLSGQARDLKTAYEQACWANSEVRELMLKEQERKQSQQRQKETQKAKRAQSAQPKPGKSSVTAAAAVEDLDDAIEKAMQDQAA